MLEFLIEHPSHAGILAAGFVLAVKLVEGLAQEFSKWISG